jgi:hypothetical protein
MPYLTEIETEKTRVNIETEIAEKRAFYRAARLNGMTLSAWARLHLRRVAADELAGEDRPADFLISAGEVNAR